MLPTPNFDMLREMEIYSCFCVHQHMYIYTFVLQDVLQVRSLFIASCSFLTGITNYQN